MKLLFSIVLLIGCVIDNYATNRALLIGIGKYPTSKTEWKQIHGDADVKLLAPALKAQKFTDITTLVNNKATKAAIIAELKKLHKRCQVGDVVYFHFSGHGQLVVDANGDEMSGYDESIVPYDAYRTSRALQGQYDGRNHLIDDELNPLLDKIKYKIGLSGKLCVTIDACYSRGIERDEEIDIDDEILNSVRGTDIPFRPINISYLKNLPKPNPFCKGASMYILTACLNTERNFECKTIQGKMYGSLSYYIYTLLKKDVDFSRWAVCLKSQDYKKTPIRIFQVFQHPNVIIYR
ncbi:caspase family protein [Leyella stercorea]|jgi:hypothetical protein|uniref:caspase family protein n=1 Tax=Leyella stercorea TaxID=363265 RepID=UPI00242D7705|nr:caspase family protein [Leyella stercorea]